MGVVSNSEIYFSASSKFCSSKIKSYTVLCGIHRVLGGSSGLEVAFLPLTDFSGLVQLTLQRSKWTELLASVQKESVVRTSGVVQARPLLDQREVSHISLKPGLSLSENREAGITSTQVWVWLV